MTPLSFVDILMGTRSAADGSLGGALPLVQRPLASAAWCLVTDDDPCFFDPDTVRLRGLRLTSKVGALDPEFLGLTVWPQTGPLVLAPKERASAYSLKATHLSPSRLKTEFLRYRASVEVIPCKMTSLFRVAFGEAGPSRVVFDATNCSVTIDTVKRELLFQTQSGQVVLITWNKVCPRSGVDGCLAWVEWDLARHEEVELKVGSLEANLDDARARLDEELRDVTPETLATANDQEWNRLLGRFDLGDEDEGKKKLFFSCLYKVLCSPRRLKLSASEPMISGWSRTLFPLIAFAYRDEWPRLLSQALEGPWSDGCALECSLLADALSQNLPIDNLESHWSQLKGQLFAESPYSTKGYVPHELGIASVTQTMEFAYRDWCAAIIARQINDGASADALEHRSSSWQRLFDDTMGFFRPRNADGTWTPDFNPLHWGEGFEGGSAWQGGWNVPHQAQELMSALGGVEITLARLDTLFALRSFFHTKPGTEEPSEATQMAVSGFGQYAHGLPSQSGTLWWYAVAGQARKSQEKIEKVVDQLYVCDPAWFAGKDGGGSSAGWYIWAQMGLFPLCPGKPEYLTMTPGVAKVAIANGNGQSLVIERRVSDDGTYRKRVGNVPLWDSIVVAADLWELGNLTIEFPDP